MARPPKNGIHLAQYQIKDFFSDESMKRIYPKNPYNIIWFMDELLSKEDLKSKKWKDFKEYLLNCISNNKQVNNDLNPFKEELIRDDLVLKRVKNIIEISNIDINSIGLATKAVRMMSVDLINGLLELNLNPNIPDMQNQNLPIEVALNRKNLKIANTYWNHPLINRFALNKNDENYAEMAIKYKNWKFFETVIADEPELIFGKKENGKFNIENIMHLLGKQKFEPNEYDLLVKDRAKQNGSNYSIVLVPERIKKLIINLLENCYDSKIDFDLSNPHIKKMWTEYFHEKLNEDIKINSLPKIKKQKI